jgi:hypothetical protein
MKLKRKQRRKSWCKTVDSERGRAGYPVDQDSADELLAVSVLYVVGRGGMPVRRFCG